MRTAYRRHLDEPGVFPTVVALCPLVEAIGRDQAPPRLEGISKSRCCIDSLDAGIEHSRLQQFLRPMRYQPPASVIDDLLAILIKPDNGTVCVGAMLYRASVFRIRKLSVNR